MSALTFVLFSRGGKNGKLENWSVLSSTVNLPAVLNDPGKGKQKDFFTRSWGVDFADSALLPPSPHLCELPPNAFDRYLRKVNTLLFRLLFHARRLRYESIIANLLATFLQSLLLLPPPLVHPERQPPLLSHQLHLLPALLCNNRHRSLTSLTSSWTRILISRTLQHSMQSFPSSGTYFNSITKLQKQKCCCSASLSVSPDDQTLSQLRARKREQLRQVED